MSTIYTTIEEIIPVLRNSLVRYLESHKLIESVKKPFSCQWHDDTGRPNMSLNPKNGYQTATCFNCHTTSSIFDFATRIENLPSNGPEWITITIPKLCERLGIKFVLGEQTQLQKDKIRLYKLCADITDILESTAKKDSYGEKRGWLTDRLPQGSINEEILIQKLTEKDWPVDYLITCGIIKTKTHSFFGEDRWVFSILDPFRRSIGFISRATSDTYSEKYIHTFDNVIFKKTTNLYGLSTDLTKCKTDRVYIFEGPGDVASAQSKGLTNCVSIFGTALTESHLLELKKLGINKVVLCLDWDKAGLEATERIIESVLPKVKDISYLIKTAPPLKSVKDPSDFFSSCSLEQFSEIPELTIFDWKLLSLDHSDPEILTKKLLPIIASESSAIRRNLMMGQLSKFIGVPVETIDLDVSALRDVELSQRKQQIAAVAQQLQADIERDPDNYLGLISAFEQEVEKIEKKFDRSVIGVNHQLNRYEDLQKLKDLSSTDSDFSSFDMKWFLDFKEALDGGMPYTRGCLIYCGGRENSAKTLSCLAISCDVALHDNNAMSIIHSIDDSYEQIEPRIKTNLYKMFYPDEPVFTLGMAVSPYKWDDKQAYKKADALFRDLLAEEKLVILDSQDGANLTSLERQIRYYRTRYPNRKLLTVCDNTHDYEDHSHLDSRNRMTLISSAQKRLGSKYNACVLATAEYRKAERGYSERMILPANQDLADARALAYRPNIIFHVYNDLADRGDKAEIFWIDPVTKKKMPRIMWLFTKNKINSFKGKLIRDIDPDTVTCRPKDSNQAHKEFTDFKSDVPKQVVKAIEEFDSELGYEEPGYEIEREDD